MSGTETPASTKDTKVEKPNRDEFEKVVKDLEEQIQSNKNIVEEVKKKLDQINQAKEKGGEKEVDPEEQKLKELRAASQKLNETRKALFEQQKKNRTQRDALREQLDQSRKTTKDLNCPSLEHLEKKIRELEYHLTTNSLTLKEEKQILSDIKGLNASKKVFSESETIRTAKDRVEEEGKEINQKLDAAKAEFEKAKAAEDAQYALVTSKREKKVTVKSEVPALLAKRKAAKEEIDRLVDTIKKTRSEFQKKDAAFRKYQNERYKEIKKKQQAEYEQREQERKLRQLEKDEEKFENLHSNEFVSIDQLVTYLNKYLADAAKEDEEEKAPVAVKVPEGTFLIGKAARGFEDDIFGTKGKVSKGKVIIAADTGSKVKKAPKKKTSTLVHDLHFIQEFQTLKVDVPLSFDAIPTAIEKLNERKVELQQDKVNQRAKFVAKKAAAETEKAAAAEQPAAAAEQPAAAVSGEVESESKAPAKEAETVEATPATATD